MSSAYNVKTAIVAVSKPGAALARRLASALPDAELHLERKLAAGGDDDTRYYDLPLRPVLQNLFVNRDALIVFLPIGAAVRLLAPVFAGKKRDAAVVCVDDGGRYAISVLSGHVGGGDELARQVAEAIGAQAIITSASDALNVTAIDLVGKAQGWRIEASPTNLTRAAAAVVNGEPVALWLDPDCGVSWPDDASKSDSIVEVIDLAEAVADDFAATLVVSDRLLAVDVAHPVVTYRPRTLVAGVGCRRGVDAAHLRELLESTLQDHDLARHSVARIATIDIKADEPGIIALAESLGVPLEIYTAAELNAVVNRPIATESSSELNRPTPSAARDLLGVFGVSEPAAMLAAGSDGLVAPRTKSDRATIAVARILPPARNSTEMSAMATYNQETMLPGERLLAMGEREISNGNLREGAGLVWRAAMAAMIAAAKRHSMPCNNREEARLFAKHLDAIADPASLPDDLSRYRNLLSFGIADSYREHYEGLGGREGTEYEWEPDEYEDHVDTVRDFIETLNVGHIGEFA